MPKHKGRTQITEASFLSEVDNGNSSTSITINRKNGNKQKITMTGNCTFSFTAPTGVCSFTLRVIQDGTGNRTITRPGTVKRPGGTEPTLSTGANAIDIVTFYYDGSTYYGMAGIGFATPA